MRPNPANLALLERSIERARALVAADPKLRDSMPSLEIFQRAVDARTSIEIVQRIVETYGERPAIGFRKHEIERTNGRSTARFLPAFETISYRSLWERVVRAASGLRHGDMLERGAIATLVGFSTVDHLVAELACHYLAAVSVPLAKTVSARELELIAGECECTALFCSIDQLPLVAKSSCPSIRTIVVLDSIAADDAHLEAIEGACVPIITLAELESRGAKLGTVSPEIPEEGTDPLLTLVYTSGSTGTPKGAMLHERSWHARWSTLPFLELTTLPMVSVVFLPQNHMGGRNAIANSLKLGGTACFTHQSDMSTLFEDIRIVRPTYVHLVPRLSEMIHQHYQSEAARRDGGEVMAEMRAQHLGDRMLLALSASAPTPPEVAAFITRCFEIPVVDIFAGTEYGQLFVDGRVNRRNVLDLKLVSVPELGYLETDQPYPRGELHVKTARAISSYFKNEKATRELFDSAGFIRTGDIFEQRGPDEMVWIDRKNNVLKLAQGEFVNLWKLEALFSSGSRFIHQIYLHGDSRRAYLLAVIVPERSELEGHDLSAVVRAELHRLAQEHALQPYEIPRDFLIELEPFSRDNGLLTSLAKPARPQLKNKYGRALEEKYQELERRLAARAPDEVLPIAERVERTIAAILGLDAIDPAQSFRNFGGDSIAAAKLCAIVERDFGVRLSVGFVLGPNTALSAVGHEVEARRPAAFDRIHGRDPEAIREKDLRLARFFHHGAVNSAPAEATNVLLTGATGFLGRFLCLELLERTVKSGGKLTCIVRAKSDAEAARRLGDVYRPGSALHERFASLANAHLDVIAGDLEKPSFGCERYRRLAEETDTVVHAAALVNHALPYAQLFDANVLATAEVLRFALQERPKRFNFISTNSVSLALLGEREHAFESDNTRALGDGWKTSGRHANGYQLSKWAGEVLTQDLFETFGLPVNVFRCNLILPPARARGQINADDFLTRLVWSVAHTGLRPRSFYDREGAHLDGFPVDFIAAAVAAIGTGPSRGFAVYHVNNAHWSDGVSLDTVIDRLEAGGYRLARLDHADWFMRFQYELRRLDPARSSLPIIDQWRSPLSIEKRQRIDASRFRAEVRALRPQGCEDIPQLDNDYFDAMLADMRALGLIPSP